MSWLISKVFGGGAAPAPAAAAAAAPASPAPAQAAAASSGLPGVAVSPPKPAPAAAAAGAATPAKGGKVTSLDGKELAQWRKDTAVDVKAVTAQVKGEVVADALGALYLMNAVGHLEIRAPRSLALLVREAKHQYAFQIYDHTGKLRLTQPVTSAMQMNYDKFNHSLIWILVLDNRTHAWSLEFENFDAEKNFKMQLAIALMEHARREDFAKAVGKNDKDWVIGGQDSAAAMEDDYDSDVAPVGAASPDGKQKDDGAFKDFEYNESRYKPSRFSIEETSAAAVAAAAASPGRRAPAKAQESDEEDDDGGSDQEEAPAPKTKTPIRVGGPAKAKSEAAFAATPTGAERNSNLAVGMANNRTFVMRGSKIGVFKHDDEDQLEYVNKIPQIKDLSGELFTPSKAMLHERDSKMLLLDPTKEDTVFCMDLERGQVIEEWQVEDETKIRNFAPTTKYAQLTNDRQVLGVNRNSVFTMDPRIGGKNKRALNQSYSKAPQLSCINASGDGYVATGDLKGEIRMFSDVSKKAKTLLPGLGDPVIGIDVTDDGNYILATTAQYLLLIPTLLPNGKTGFQVGMGAQKPTPIKLQLSPVDLVKHDIKSVAFTAAHFNTGKDISEEWIVTASGPFIITWNLKRVLKGFTKEYKIKRVYQDVVADTFRYGKEDQVVVTTADDAYVEKRTITMRQKGAAAAAAAAGAGAGAAAAKATPKK